MSAAPQEPQEQRSETFGIRLTPTEKRAIRWVSDLHNISESDLVRTSGLDDVFEKIVARYHEARAAATIQIEPAEPEAA